MHPVNEVTLSNNAPQVGGGITVGQLYGVAWIAYLSFDITSLPQDATVQSINLKVKSAIFTSGNKWVNAYAASSDWTESTVNWDNRPTQGQFIDVEWVDLYNEWYVWDCTGKLYSQNNTVSVTLQLLSGSDGYLEFYSANSTNPSQLEIKYTVPDPTPTPDPTLSPIKLEPTTIIIVAAVLLAILAGIVVFLLYVFKVIPKAHKVPPPPQYQAPANRICTQCGRAVQDNIKFCPNCGKQLN